MKSGRVTSSPVTWEKGMFQHRPLNADADMISYWSTALPNAKCRYTLESADRHSSMQPGAKRWIKIILNTLALGLFSAVLGGVTYEQIGQ
jgi:hypothetical protein